MTFIEKIVDSTPFRVFLESIFVGGYTLILFLVLTCIIEQPIYVVLFILGCIKHYSGYVVGLHDRYCRRCSGYTSSAPPTAFEIVGEGFIFLIVELFIHCIFTNIYLNIFVLGAVIHIGFESFGLHRWFCITHCRH
jgi:hypothetical protein